MTQNMDEPLSEHRSSTTNYYLQDALAIVAPLTTPSGVSLEDGSTAQNGTRHPGNVAPRPMSSNWRKPLSFACFVARFDLQIDIIVFGNSFFVVTQKFVRSNRIVLDDGVKLVEELPIRFHLRALHMGLRPAIISFL
jgi:hypothetical protein